MHWTRSIRAAALAAAAGIAFHATPAHAAECGMGAGVPAGTLAAPAAPAPCRIEGRRPVQLHPEPPKPKEGKRRPHDFEFDNTTVKMNGSVGADYPMGPRH